ncbi:conserved protein of unknown function [Ectopseudomonas oleovorans]|uniref:Uncharacterized protein n=1 Tax=Ectopseudomonas oleovorans TaxID=301 RepID=A0A653B2W8_ECTOL|nr:conserved protein of unknown function [Pseudomonas oleovorans]
MARRRQACRGVTGALATRAQGAGELHCFGAGVTSFFVCPGDIFNIFPIFGLAPPSVPQPPDG